MANIEFPIKKRNKKMIREPDARFKQQLENWNLKPGTK